MTPGIPPKILRKPSPPKPSFRPQAYNKPNIQPSAPSPSSVPNAGLRTPRSSPSPAPPLFRTVARTAGTVLVALAGFIFVRDNIISIDTVRGSSMAPTLSPTAHETGQNDWVLISRWFPRENIERGDIVTFWKPHKPDQVSIKRVIGIEGDEIYPQRGYALDKETLKEKRLGLNDGLVTKLNLGAESLSEAVPGKVVVPHGHVWVEGDNWRRSYDSCDFGPVSRALIDGKAVKVWKEGWFRDIEDLRNRGKGSRMVQGTSVLPLELQD